ncbi:MAG: hypothetical protein RIR25_730 [Verrucomicrobiota bacterium]|jgi:hypothetical protein
MSGPEATECDELTVIDDATGLSVSVPILPGASILSRSGRSAMLIAEAMLAAKIAELANAR